MQSRIVILFFILAFGTSFFNCTQQEKKKAGQSSAIDSVAVINLKKLPLLKKLTFPAELIPVERAEISARMQGYVKELKVDIGDQVKKGEILVILDAPELIASYAQASAEAQTVYAKHLTSKDRYKRYMNASKVAGTMSAAEMESAKNQMLADSSAAEAARSKLNISSQLKDYLILRSPFDGIVTQRNADKGTLTGTSGSKPILMIENVGVLRLRIPVPETYSAAIPDTSVVKFAVDALPGKIFQATLSRKSGSISLSNRTETWEFTVQNPGKVLKSGMYANATLQLGREELSFLVPTSAVVTNLEKKFVIRLKDGQTEWVDVKTGFNQNDKIEIFGSLQEGDNLLTSASDEIKPGMKLKAKATKK